MPVTSKTIIDENSKLKKPYPLNKYNEKVLSELDNDTTYSPFEQDDELFRRACYMTALRKVNQTNQKLNADKIVYTISNMDSDQTGDLRENILSLMADPEASESRFNELYNKIFNKKDAAFQKVKERSMANAEVIQSLKKQDTAETSAEEEPIKEELPVEEKPIKEEPPAEEKPKTHTNSNATILAQLKEAESASEQKESEEILGDESAQGPASAPDTENPASQPAAAEPSEEEIPDDTTMLGNDSVDTEQQCTTPASSTGTQEPATEPAPIVNSEPESSPEPQPAEPPRAQVHTPADNGPDIPETPEDPRTKYEKVYSAIDAKAISTEQAEEAKSYADVVLSEPDEHPKEFNALTKGGAMAERVIAGFLGTANRQLGYRSNEAKPDDRLKFGGRTTQSRNTSNVGSTLVMPEGFGAKKTTAMWNQPVITEFGFPFINFSSIALINVLKAKDDESAQNSLLKQMFKDAKDKYGGVWKAIYASPMSLIRQIAHDKGDLCTPCYLKVNGNNLIESEGGDEVEVTPIMYYSVDAEFDDPVSVPRDFIANFYDVIDYTSSSKRTYLKYSGGMTAADFAEETDANGGIPPFYILVPKKALYSRCDVRPGSLFGSLLNIILGRKPCTMVKTILDGKKGCIVMEEAIADAIFADV